MTEASTANPNNNKSHRPRGERLDMAQQLQALRGDSSDAATVPEAAADAPSAPAQARPRPQKQRRSRKAQPAQGPQPQQQPARQQRKVHPVLERLFELYPNLFGARFLPLKRGVFEELIARHPEEFKAEELKVAMGLHARSTRYLESVAAGHPRHDLDGNVAEAVAPEHVHHAILELHRRRSQRTEEDLRPQLVARLARAVETSGLDREAYAVLVRSRDANNNAVLDEALALLAEQAAKREALLRAFEASGRSSEKEFADMYGMNPAEVARTLQRVRSERAAAAGQAAAD
ncbi:ProQ/FINO family protein [Xenophilus arseniciresistens]|uniref:ProQ/FINO family protein n=1 Tax=Xenophilus arseniciresistens TaxID=1283306 RepID=A0AAE3NCK1_9BURK|nr:ProQ/FINO family protein [Xenophilus arseniciresistens]MDA7417852.1 ProQ/FINO family protein [Xenophilus arseniciresistens]